MNEGENDWNGNNKKYELIKVGPYQWYTCEDRVYCFLVEPCDLLGDNAIRGCKELLCQSFLEKYEGNTEWANEALLKTVQFSTKCNLNKIPITEREMEDWYTRYFKTGCGEEGEVETGKLTLKNCRISLSDKKITCETNCLSVETFTITDGSITIQDEPEISGGELTLVSDQIVNLDCGTTIWVALTCSNPDDAKSVTATCVG